MPDPVPYESKRPLPPPDLTCPKCGSPMVRGVMSDGAGGQLWWWAGQMRRVLGMKAMPRGERSTIVTYRCAGCGYLESYGSAG